MEQITRDIPLVYFLSGLVYLGGSVIAFLLYLFDKFAAIKKWRRIPERTLHLVALLGGWPGAGLAQYWVRHKNRKAGFKLVYFATAFINLIINFGFIIIYG